MYQASLYMCRILTSLSQCGAYPQIPGRGRTGMTASFSYRGDVSTQSSVVRPWYYSHTSSVILSDCGRAVARSRYVHRDVPCADGCALLLSHVNQINMTREKRVSWFV